MQLVGMSKRYVDNLGLGMIDHPSKICKLTIP
jgi:hypothetical protein